MIVRGDGVESLELPFHVGGGERTSSHALSRVGVAVIHLELPEGAERRGSMWGELSDEDGRIVWQSDRSVPARGPLELRASARAGTWRFRGGTNTGLRAEGEVRVPVVGEDVDAARLSLRPE